MNKNVTRYPAYKHLEIDWLGEIPSHWDLSLLKRFTNVYNGSTPSTSNDENWNGDIIWYTPDDLGSNKSKAILSSNRKITDEGLKNCGATLVPSNSIIISTRAPIGHIAITEFEATTNQGCKSIVTNDEKVFSEFIYYYLLSNKGILQSLGSGSTFTELSTNELKSFPFILPPLTEQKAIASFLDHQSTRINQLIEKKKRLLELLDEQRQAIITNAVTKGVNPDAQMKNSGIDWLGEVPEHWDVTKVKRVGSIKYGLGEPPEKMDGGLPFIRATDIFRGIINSERIQYINPDAVPWSRNPELKAKDILVVRSGAYTGDSAIVPPEFEGAIAGYDMVFTCTQVIPEFIANAFLSRYILEAQFYVARSRAAQPHLNAEELGNCILLLPPITEQKKIITFLSRKKNQVDQLKTKIQTAIDRLEEYRSSLITQAVTGKINVHHSQAKIKSTKKRANIYFQRTVLAARILDELHSEPTMGRRKLQKILFLLEKHVEGIRLAGKYVKAAAGPFDNKLMRSVEKQLKDQDWFIKSGRKNGYGYLYIPGDNKGGYLKYYPRYWGDAESEISNFLNLVRAEKTDLLSCSATLYACWNDFMIKGHEIKGVELIKESKFNWHKEKEEISVEDWKEALNWLWYNNIRPSGSGDLTKEI